MTLKKFRKLIKFLGLYPPYLGAGIRVTHVSADCMRYEVAMKLRWWNRNIYGTHFGGSLYSMCDPFFCFIVYNYLGSDYIVWDKSAQIEFVSPGNSKVTAVFESEIDILHGFKQEVDQSGKATIFFSTNVLNDKGQIVAKVKKEVYARKKGGR